MIAQKYSAYCMLCVMSLSTYLFTNEINANLVFRKSAIRGVQRKGYSIVKRIYGSGKNCIDSYDDYKFFFKLDIKMYVSNLGRDTI